MRSYPSQGSSVSRVAQLANLHVNRPLYAWKIFISNCTGPPRKRVLDPLLRPPPIPPPGQMRSLPIKNYWIHSLNRGGFWGG